jgi:phosphoethanolamine N-methyltransferase
VVPKGGAGSLDVVFTNWLMMYLSDDEVQTLAKKALSWLKTGGYFFVRESCFHPSGNMPRQPGNPTSYRDPSKYCELFQVISNESGPLFEGGHEFELQFATSVKTYIKRKNNPNQICWLYRKVSRAAPPLQRTQSLQEFLDGDQYTQRGILKYERIYGNNFVSVGGRTAAEEFLQQLDIKAGECVLDVGAGVGGAAFLMVKTYNAYVLAMDLSSNMVTIGMQRRIRESIDESGITSPVLLNQLSFEISDINKREYESNAFDCIHSRETLLHLKDKPMILKKFQKWLKPGGKLLITDYCRGEKAEDSYSRPYRKYIQGRGYYPATVSGYAELLRAVGFTKITAKNNNEMFARVLREELATLEKSEKSFVNEFSQYEYDQAVLNWRSKIKFCEEGDLVWGFFSAEKPLPGQEEL